MTECFYEVVAPVQQELDSYACVGCVWGDGGAVEEGGVDEAFLVVEIIGVVIGYYFFQADSLENPIQKVEPIPSILHPSQHLLQLRSPYLKNRQIILKRKHIIKMLIFNNPRIPSRSECPMIYHREMGKVALLFGCSDHERGDEVCDGILALFCTGEEKLVLY